MTKKEIILSLALERRKAKYEGILAMTCGKESKRATEVGISILNFKKRLKRGKSEMRLLF